MSAPIRILCNLAFWSSRSWTDATDTIYDRPSANVPTIEYPPWKSAWELFRRKKNYDVIVTMGARESLFYGLLCALTGQVSRQVMMEVFIDDVQTPTPAWRIKTALYRWVARRTLGIQTNSSPEVKTMAARYGLPEDRFEFVPMHTNITDPQWTEHSEGYLFSAGRTLRDYPALIESVRDLTVPVKIVCGTADLNDIDLPPHVELHREIDRAAYLRLLKGCSMVLLPLLPTERSTGQVVMFEAMALGKPVITSRAPGTVDVIRDGENGRLLTCGDVEGFRAALHDWLAHPEQAETCARQALQDILDHYTVEKHGQRKLDSVKRFAGL